MYEIIVLLRKFRKYSHLNHIKGENYLNILRIKVIKYGNVANVSATVDYWFNPALPGYRSKKRELQENITNVI